MAAYLKIRNKNTWVFIYAGFGFTQEPPIACAGPYDNTINSEIAHYNVHLLDI